jgi:hypothetical protein
MTLTILEYTVPHAGFLIMVKEKPQQICSHGSAQPRFEPDNLQDHIYSTVTILSILAIARKS